MPTSSAKPAKLLEYRSGGLAQVVLWEPEVTNVGTALRGLRDALALVELPQDCQVTVTDLETSFDELTRNQRHLDEWVGEVGEEFLRANGLSALLGMDFDTFGSMVLTVEDASLDVGYADRALAELAGAGEEAAAALRALLDDSGLLAQGSGGYLSPGDPNYDAITQLLEQVGAEMDSEAYAVGFYNALGVDGIRAIGAVLDSLVHLEFTGVEPRAERLLDPLAHGFALASAALTPEVRDGLLDLGQPPYQREDKELALALLLTAEGHLYDPAFLAEAAERLIMDTTRGLPGVPQALAMRALADNTEASWFFADGGTENLEVLLRPAAFYDPLVHPLEAVWLDDIAKDGRVGAYVQWSADVVQNAFGQAVVDEPQRYERALELYADVVRMVGDGDISDPARRAVAEPLEIYLPAMGDAAYRQSEAGWYADAAAQTAHDFNRPDLVDFFQELGRDEGAAELVGQAVTTWAEVQSLIFLDGSYPSDSEIDRAFVPVAQIMGTIEDGFDAIGEESLAAKEALARGVGLGGGIVSAGMGIAGLTAGALVAPVAAPIIAGTGGVIWMGMSLYALQLPGTAGGAPIPGMSFEDMVLQQLERDLAIAVAEQRGEPPPGPGEYKDTLLDAWGEGDPYERLRSRLNTEVRHDPDQHWSVPAGTSDLRPAILDEPAPPAQLRDVIAEFGPPGSLPQAADESVPPGPPGGAPRPPTPPPVDPSRPPAPPDPGQPGPPPPLSPPDDEPEPPAIPTTHRVRGDESFWTIAEHVLSHRGADPSESDIHRYWHQLIDANRERLPDPDNPDLLPRGLELTIPNPRRD